jgi:two-component system, cell cycle response regulator DivK
LRVSKKASILVVDDSPDSREMLAEYLAFRQFPVSTAGSGEEAIAVASRVCPDVILMDLSMPGIGGWEAIRQLKADPRTRKILIVAASGHAFAPERKLAREAGCDGFIVKPYDITMLGDALESILTDGMTALSAAPRPPRKSEN